MSPSLRHQCRSSKPIKQLHLSVSLVIEKLLCAGVYRMLALAVIEESQNAWSLPATIVVKLED